MKTSKFVWSTLAAFALLLATTSMAWGEKVNFTYAGTGWDTTVDSNDDGFPVNISSANAKGSLGASRVEIRGEWMLWDVAYVACEVGELEFKLIFSTSVATFQNQSQLFAYSNMGWMCVDTTTGHYYGKVFGIYGGGAGKFVGASGEWQTDFDGFFLEPPDLPAAIGFRSITGIVKGNFELPE